MSKFNDKCKAMGWEEAHGDHLWYMSDENVAADNDTLTPAGAVAVLEKLPAHWTVSTYHSGVKVHVELFAGGSFPQTATDFCTAVRDAWLEGE